MPCLFWRIANGAVVKNEAQSSKRVVRRTKLNSVVSFKIFCSVRKKSKTTPSKG